MTEIGERGINLSGGQKARVALARTVYADADIYLLDDPLAAVDAHVGQHLFEQCILTLKKRNKCIILVTNALQFLRSSTSIVVLREGQIVESGSYDDLLSSGYWLNEMIKTHMDSSNSTSMSKEVSIITDIAQQSSIHTETDALMSTPHIPVTLDAVDNALNDKMKRQADGLDEIEDMTNVKPKQTLRLTESGKLLTIEDKEVGDVGMEVGTLHILNFLLPTHRLHWRKIVWIIQNSITNLLRNGFIAAYSPGLHTCNVHSFVIPTASHVLFYLII